MAESARLSPLQRETIIKLRDLYLRNVGILARRRQRLTAVLQVRADSCCKIGRSALCTPVPFACFQRSYRICRLRPGEISILQTSPVCAADGAANEQRPVRRRH